MPRPAPKPSTAAIREAAAAARHTQAALDALLYAACPGPHRYRQHRDHLPPWCPACRYTATGEPVPPKTGPTTGPGNAMGYIR